MLHGCGRSHGPSEKIFGSGATDRRAEPSITPPPTDQNAAKFELGPNPTTVTAILSDGSTLTAEINYGEQFGVGYARIPVPGTLTVTEARSS